MEHAEDKSLLALIEIAIDMSSYTSGSLSTTWQIFLQRYPRRAGDGFAQGEACYEIGKHGEDIFGSRPGYKTLREALVSFIRRGLEEYRGRQRKSEEAAAQGNKSAEEWRERIAHIESLVGTDDRTA
jgi:hypothetical protein